MFCLTSALTKVNPTQATKSGANAIDRPHPWVRAFARFFDMVLWAAVLKVIFIFAADPRLRQSVLANGYLFSALVGLTWFLAESSLLSLFGSTPGKGCLGIRLQPLQGRRFLFRSAMNRSFSVYTLGLACCVPTLSLLTCALAYHELTDSGATEWDRGKFHVVCLPVTAWQLLLLSCMALVTLLFVLVPWGSSV